MLYKSLKINKFVEKMTLHHNNYWHCFFNINHISSHSITFVGFAVKFIIEIEFNSNFIIILNN